MIDKSVNKIIFATAIIIVQELSQHKVFEIECFDGIIDLGYEILEHESLKLINVILYYSPCCKSELKTKISLKTKVSLRSNDDYKCIVSIEFDLINNSDVEFSIYKSFDFSDFSIHVKDENGNYLFNI